MLAAHVRDIDLGWTVVAIGSYERTIFVLDTAGRLRRFSLDTGATLETILCDTKRPYALGACLAVHVDGAMRVMSPNGTLRFTLPAPPRSPAMYPPLSAPSVDSFDAAGTVAVGGTDQRALVWNASSGEQVAELACEGLWRAVVSPDGTRVALLRSRHVPILWSPATGKSKKLAGVRLDGGASVTWSADGASLVLINQGWTSSEAFVCDAERARVRKRFRVRTQFGAFVPDRDVFVIAGGRALHVWSATTWKELGSIPVRADGVIVASNRIVTLANTTLSIWEGAALLDGIVPVAPRKRAVKQQRGPRAVFFGVPAKLSRAQIVRAIADLHYILDRQPADFAIKLVRGRERQWLTCVATRGRNYLLEPWIESLCESLHGPIDVVIHLDDRVEARRYSSGRRCTTIENPTEHVAALDGEGILVVAKHRRVARPIKSAAIKDLVNVVELAWPRALSP